MAIFSPDFAAIQLNKTEVYFNKPIYIGLSVLDISKTIFYDFHYSYMIPRVGAENCPILYMDTDSFIYCIKGTKADKNNIYKIMKEDCEEYFDTSGYKDPNPYDIPQKNKKLLEK